jgi:Kef-type K+ transport system membrane component KefB
VPLTSFDLSVRLLLQLVVILAACQAAAWLFAKAGQSKVVSEMIAGVLLGPSLLGWLWPAASAYLFPKASMPVLFALAQVGLVLYMFLVGVEFDVGLVRERLRAAAFVSAAGIAAPFALGGLLAAALHGRREPPLFGSGVPVPQAILAAATSASRMASRRSRHRTRGFAAPKATFRARVSALTPFEADRRRTTAPAETRPPGGAPSGPGPP